MVDHDLWHSDQATAEANLKLAIEKSMSFLLFLGLPISIGLFVAAPEIIGFLYHRPEFAHSISALQGLAPGLIFLYINTVFSATIISTKRETKITIMAAIALIFNLGLNLFLIPLYQQIGAAIITSLTELLLLCLSVVFIPKHLLPLGSLRVAAKATIAGFVMALTIWVLGIFQIVNIFLILPVAMVIYFGLAAAIGTIPREDIQALYRAIGRKVHLSSEPLESQEDAEQGLQKGEKPASIVEASSSAPFALRGQIGGSLSSTTHPELALHQEDMELFSDLDAEKTEPQLEIPWWLPRHQDIH